ncbi:MAG: hypothetical protein FWE00_07060 [Defluviitaleaceae bacterium]|nr:hypothetical protein [Defluviitaleaceae bacterium]
MRNKTMLFFQISSVLFAILYGLFAYFLIYRLIARGDVFWTYLLNIVYIAAVLLLDNAAHRFAAKKANTIRHMLYRDMGPISRNIYILTQGFCRTGMYMFYIAVLILSRVTILRPELIHVELRDFFVSLEYGLILLIVFDKLRELMMKDREWFKENLENKLMEDS